MFVGVSVGVEVIVGTGVSIGEGVMVGVGVFVGVGVGVIVSVRVGVRQGNIGLDGFGIVTGFGGRGMQNVYRSILKHF